jgi:outer membrane protein OmpA-like peptidoglycan-associated protein
MRVQNIFILIMGVIFAHSSFGQNFKELHTKALTHLDNENYQDALTTLLEMEKLDAKNYKTKANIGYCYLVSDFEKAKAISYFDLILENYKNLTPTYDRVSHKEKSAPVEVLHWIGKAYHYNYEFEKALAKYTEYKEVLNPSNTAFLTAINRDIAITKNAMMLKENPVEMQIVGIANINTLHPEYRPKITGDENIMYFTSRRPNETRNAQDAKGLYYEDVYYSVRKFGEWSQPSLLDDNINSASHDACLYISPDGQYMLVFRAGSATLTEGGIYESTLNGETWSTPSLLAADVNSNYWETDVNISADRKTMYFTSNRPGGQGERDIWIMKKLPNGDWASVQNIGSVINTKYDEEAPYLHPDGKTLYFSSKGHNTMGGYDVFSTELGEDGTWSPPKNVGFPINTTGDDVFYFPTNDGQRAYFSSYRDGGKGDQDIYILKLPENEEKTLAIYKGDALYDDGSVIENLVISIYDDNTGDEIGIYRPNTTTGRFLFILQPGQSYDIEFDADGVLATDAVNVPSEGGVLEITKLVIKEGDSLFIKAATANDQDIITLVEDENPDNLIVRDLNIGATKPKADSAEIAEAAEDAIAIETAEDAIAIETAEAAEAAEAAIAIEIAEAAEAAIAIETAEDAEDAIAIETAEAAEAAEAAIAIEIAEAAEAAEAAIAIETSIKDTVKNVIKYQNQTSLLKDIYFKYDKVILIDESEIDYDKALTYLKSHTDTKVMIEGHTDSHGSSEYNWWLSSARSNKIRNRMYDNGISWGRMDTRGYGEDKPIARNKNLDGSDNPDGRLLNRRVTFVLDESAISELNADTVDLMAEERPVPNFTQEYDEATISLSDEIACMIQLGAFSEALNNEKFTDQPLEVSYYKDEDGLYKYLSGVFVNKEIALEHRLRMIDTGYEGAFIVYFKDGKRLNSEEIALLYPSEDGIELIETTVNNK